MNRFIVKTRQIEKFWAKVDIRDKDSCWNWLGALSSNGYGAVWTGASLVGAHKFSWCICNLESVPEGLYVCHKCDNKRCCNPDHLYLGTPSDNISDREARIPWKKGTGGLAKLDYDKADEIRELYSTGKYFQWDIARRFGVSRQCISDVITGRKWKSVQ